MATAIKTGVGRIVWGHPTKGKAKTDKNKQPVFKDGKPVIVYAFGLAIPKAEFGAIWAAMVAEASSIFGQNVTNMPNFSWKYKDGDAYDKEGRPYNQREGYAGCYVLNISTEAFAPPMVKVNAQGTGYDNITEEAIKTGDYAVVALNLVAQKPSDSSHTPSIYVNPAVVQFIGYGQEIFNGPDAMTLLGGPQTYALPPGASATPMVPAGAPGMPMPGQPQGQAPQPAPSGMPGQPAQNYQPQPAQNYQPQPAPGGMPGAPQGQPAYQPPAGQPAYQPQPGHPAPGSYPPATDFVPNAMGQPAPGGMPMQGAPQPGMPGNAPMPGGMPGVPTGGMQ